MAASFLHGVEVVRVRKGKFVVRVVKTAIVGIVGTAPVHLVDAADKTVNQLVLLPNETADAKSFGPEMAGYTLPTSLKQIREQQEPGAGVIVYAVNVFDPAVHKTAVANEAKTFANNTLTLAFLPIPGTVVVTNQAGDTTYTITEDFTVDASTGVITRVADGTIANNAQVKVSYDKANPAAVVAADVIGETDENGIRTGMQLFKEGRSKYGASPKILIAPGFSTQTTVEAALAVVTTAVGGNYIVDAPIGTTVAEAIEGRGANGTINFGGANPRKICAFPHLKRYFAPADAIQLVPFSPALAGVMAVVDQLKGYWVSPSNNAIKGIVGLELNLTADFADATCEVNLLNEVGIVTVANFNGDFLVWGNRNASFPSVANLESFIPMQRLADVVDESILLAMLPFADQSINRVLIDEEVETVNRFLNTLKGRGALIDGKCWFLEEENTTDTLTLGNTRYAYDFCGGPPNERQTFYSSSNPDYLAQLLGGN